MQSDVPSRQQLAEQILRGETPHAVLGVPRAADLAEAKAAFRTIALALHPDKTDLHSAAEAFRRASEALQQLKDAQAAPRWQASPDAPAAASSQPAGGSVDTAEVQTARAVWSQPPAEPRRPWQAGKRPASRPADRRPLAPLPAAAAAAAVLSKARWEVKQCSRAPLQPASQSPASGPRQRWQAAPAQPRASQPAIPLESDTDSGSGCASASTEAASDSPGSSSSQPASGAAGGSAALQAAAGTDSSEDCAAAGAKRPRLGGLPLRQVGKRLWKQGA